jgi:hypothetical protein
MTAEHGAAGDLIETSQLVEDEVRERSIARRQWSFSRE